MSILNPIIEPASQIASTFEPSCKHCGEPCEQEKIVWEGESFCCQGCQMVYEILQNNNLCRYYDLDEKAGISLKGKKSVAYAYLDDPEVVQKLIDFSDGNYTKVTFFIPQMHCASCIWLLEKLYKLSPGIYNSNVNFVKKEIYLTYKEDTTTLRQVVELLASIGYEPAINLNNLSDTKPIANRAFFYKLGVAGFAFGNIMLLSFPEYLGLDKSIDSAFFQIFGYLNILLAIPVVLYSGWDYLRSAWQGIRQGFFNIDVPISLGVLTLFLRSVYEIISHTGAGYLDSLAGLIFFLLIGKWFQQRTYHNLSFDRDYKSYFPIAAHRKENGQLRSVTLDKLEPGDTIVVKSNELIPADSLLVKGEAAIDYSFVSGESETVQKMPGDRLFAGGKQVGAPIEVNLIKKVSQSYLTQLWNDEAFTKKTVSSTTTLADRVGRFFTSVILLVAFVTLAYWLPRDTGVAINAFTSVLIIACPCAVALAIPFIFGNVIRILGKHHFYLKNTQVVESLNAFQSVVFDKTGTITARKKGHIEFQGKPLSALEINLLIQVLQGSNHPISQQLEAWLREQNGQSTFDQFPLSDWKEVIGKGIEAICCQKIIRIGSYAFMDDFSRQDWPEEKGVYLQINHEIRGFFKIENNLRASLWEVLDFFKQRANRQKRSAKLYLLSGDNDRESALLLPLFEQKEHMHFAQSPQQKLDFIKTCQDSGEKVLMLGDGLNDAGALKQSDVGIVVAEDTNNFTPACDAILNARQFAQLPRFIQLASGSIRLVYAAYGLALVYNIIGLSFAVQGTLSPIVAAILMPLSSITIVVFGMLSSNWLAKRLGL
ncbi:MAG TPA: heavy metal translocating P-type ATPase metal-binding domain-containing protein [Saprospiraceae bacterium]|nr:heavy metal translocating P-type ATPase metal-binding domain-containing protein [Saprospiraceae bacterium]HMQ84281.1 heavy metal translocating P-type ATPase metal-binding domain-containing protein [Saprospiraceae bacterium]